MCGIFSFAGTKDASQKIFNGLKRLEYRGYDSWGISVIDSKGIKTEKRVGELPEGFNMNLDINSMGIGHTRWATHGGVNITNAHPHYSEDKRFVLAQNGIVENYDSLKKYLEKKGYIFKTDVDTEVIVKLIELYLKDTKDIRKALIKSFKKLDGRNTVVLLDSENQQVLAIRNGSPLVLGIDNKDIYLASDSLAFSNYTNHTVDINDNELIHVKDGKYTITNILSNKEINRKSKVNSNNNQDIEKGKYDHFMLKEISEQYLTIQNATSYSKEYMDKIVKVIKKSNLVITVGAGTAGFAADQIAYYLRKISHINAYSTKSYEIESFLNLFNSKTTLIALSQSGETADTIEAINFAKEKGAKIISVVNMPSSTISRISDISVMSNAGPEICVASTKVFTSQISFGYLLSRSIVGEYSKAKEDINILSSNLKGYFSKKTFNDIDNISKLLVKDEHFFILGKGRNFSIAQEGALKVKEISYKHFEGFAAGELKHGVIALVDKGTPVFSIISKDGNEKDMISSTQEVKARGALTIGIGDSIFKSYECFDYFIPVAKTDSLKDIANVIPFQLISYFLAKRLGNNIDKPRNLAKSVTVK